MSQKEKLIRQYFALKHKFDMNESCKKPYPAEPTEKDIHSMQKEFKVMDLEYKISCVETALKDQAIRIEREKHFTTDEGKLTKKNPTACFIEVKRWFNEKLEAFTKQKGENNKWVNELKNSSVYCRADDGNGNTVGWYRIIGFEDHGADVTLRIVKMKSEE